MEAKPQNNPISPFPGETQMEKILLYRVFSIEYLNDDYSFKVKIRIDHIKNKHIFCVILTQQYYSINGYIFTAPHQYKNVYIEVKEKLRQYFGNIISNYTVHIK